MLNLVVREETARLQKVKMERFILMMFNILCRFNHSNGTVILQTVMTYGRILHKHTTNVHQQNPT